MKVIRMTTIAECGICGYELSRDNWVLAQQHIVMHVYGEHQDIPEIAEALVKDKKAAKHLAAVRAEIKAMRDAVERPVEDVPLP